MSEEPGQEIRPAPRRGADGNLKSLQKIVRVLDCFSTGRRALSVSDICALTGFPRSTTHRLLASMRDVGFLEQEHERDQYRLGLKLFELGSIALTNLELHREGRDIVDALHRLTGRTVHLAVFDGERAVVIQRNEVGADALAPSTFVENSPAHCTSVGKAILAHQDAAAIDRVVASGLERFTETTLTDPEALRADLVRTRTRGYAVDEGEHRPGIRCIGAPIRNQSGRVFAAISVSAPSWQLPPDDVAELAAVVVYHANQISRRLGHVRTEGAVGTHQTGQTD
ncbi:MAG: IclR family transcriptional regulator [Rhodobacteraceae bacterium]|nr:IclR family transcriptional regulator [Paracoccaceae bacterium]